MKVVGSHDEIMMLKLQCANYARCDYCALQPFCRLHSQQTVESWTMKITYNTIGGSSQFYKSQRDEWITQNDDGTITYYKNSEPENKHEQYKKGSPLSLLELTTIPTVLITKEGEADDIKRESEEHSVQLGENSDG